MAIAVNEPTANANPVMMAAALPVAALRRATMAMAIPTMVDIPEHSGLGAMCQRRAIQNA